MIVVVDYASGNLNSVSKALKRFADNVKISSCATDILQAEKLILPGVGAFGDAVNKLRKLGLIKPIKKFIQSGKPYLGICLGMQLLFEKSEESNSLKGLALLKGKVSRFKANKDLKVPHMGWNEIVLNKKNRNAAKLFSNVKNKSFVYFCHSYCVADVEKKYILSNTIYADNFVSAVCAGNIYGVQFHPEKSQKIGLRIIKNFIELC